MQWKPERRGTGHGPVENWHEPLSEGDFSSIDISSLIDGRGYRRPGCCLFTGQLSCLCRSHRSVGWLKVPGIGAAN